MTRAAKLSIRYSISFKQKVVKEIEQEGVSVEVIRRRYGIKGGSTVQRWLKEFGKNHLLSKIVRIEMQGGTRQGKGIGGRSEPVKSRFS